jgi:hypothetical protein
MERDHPNISTDHQPRGAALNPDDELDRNPSDRPKGSKRDSETAAIDDQGRPHAPPGGPR